jgi:hypothetical protein
VTSIDENGELDALRASVIEERLDGRANRASGVEHVVDEDDGLAFERKVECRRAHDRLRMPGSGPTPNLDVVAVEGDVDRAEIWRRACALFDQPSQTVRERHTTRLDADERDASEIGIRLDDLVRDPRQRPAERISIE